MGVVRSVVRFITTLGGLISSRVDEGTDAVTTTPAGVRAAFKTTRDNWTRQYHEVRDAVAQLLMVMEQKRAEVARLGKDREELAVKKRGAIEKFRQTQDAGFQKVFEDAHAAEKGATERLEALGGEVAGLEEKIASYKARLAEMQLQIRNLDKQEAEAIADIVSSKQIVELNDRMAKLSTSLHDENLQAIERARQSLRAKATLSSELAGSDASSLERQALEAGRSSDAQDEFHRLVAEAELKAKERPGGQQERTL